MTNNYMVSGSVGGFYGGSVPSGWVQMQYDVPKPFTEWESKIGKSNNW